MSSSPKARRLGATSRPTVTFFVDGEPVSALEGDTILTSLILTGRFSSSDDYTGATLAGFCLMGACQGCWIWTEDAGRVRACETLVRDGQKIHTVQKGPDQ